MPEWLKDLLVAIGGGSVVLIGILTIFKQLFLKLFETGIEASFEKNMEKYRNKLSRSTKAYEILLDKELGFYNVLDPYFATLVPLVQDLVYYSDMNNEMDLSFRQSHYKDNMLKYLEIIPNIKNDIVLYQSYVPTQVFAETSHLVKLLQIGNLSQLISVSKTHAPKPTTFFMPYYLLLKALFLKLQIL